MNFPRNYIYHIVELNFIRSSTAHLHKRGKITGHLVAMVRVHLAVSGKNDLCA